MPNEECALDPDCIPWSGPWQPGDSPGFTSSTGDPELDATIKGLQKKDGPWVDWNALSDDEKKVLKEYGGGTRPSLRQNRIFH